MTKEEAIAVLRREIEPSVYEDEKSIAEAVDMAIEALSADAVSEDTQTEEQARFVAKETELAHIEARLENAEKRLQGVCVANFVAEQLERLKDMTDEERLKLLQTMFPSADAVSREALNDVKFVAIKGDKVEEAYRSGWNGAIECIIENAPSADAVQGEWIDRSNGGELNIRGGRVASVTNAVSMEAEHTTSVQTAERR